MDGTHTPEYSTWGSMKERCLNKDSKAYPDYGGRGITICDRWMDFANFLEDMGTRPPGTTIDRIDNNKGYYKENCRWATQREQCNNKRNNIIIEHNGERMSVSQWSIRLGFKRTFIWARMSRGRTFEQAITGPFRKSPTKKINA